MRFTPGCKCCCKLCVTFSLTCPDPTNPDGYQTWPESITCTVTDEAHPPKTIGTFVATGQITALAVTGAGDYGSMPTPSLSDPTGTGGSVGLVMHVNSATVAVGGSGYKVNDVLTIAHLYGSPQAALKVTSVDAQGAITGLAIVQNNYNQLGALQAGTGQYQTVPAGPVTLAYAPNTRVNGQGATANLRWGIHDFVIENAGTGYTPGKTTVSFSGGNGSGGAATVTSVFQGCLSMPGAGTYQVSAPAGPAPTPPNVGIAAFNATVDVICPSTTVNLQLEVQLLHISWDGGLLTSDNWIPDGGGTCCPTGAFPVTATLAGPLGSGINQTFTFTDCSSQYLWGPPGVYTITGSCPKLIQTTVGGGTLYPVPSANLPGPCKVNHLKGGLYKPPDNTYIFIPALGVCRKIPTSLKVTFDNSATWGAGWKGQTVTFPMSLGVLGIYAEYVTGEIEYGAVNPTPPGPLGVPYGVKIGYYYEPIQNGSFQPRCTGTSTPAYANSLPSPGVFGTGAGVDNGASVDPFMGSITLDGIGSLTFSEGP